MSVTVRTASSADYDQVVHLLEAAGLPTAGLRSSLPDFLVGEEDGRIVGAVGLEVYGEAALLRSAVVESSRRGGGLGNGLVSAVLTHAAGRGVREIYLLTTTAEDYFPRFGFTLVDRETITPTVRASEEFRGACPESAVAMRKVLDRV